MGKTYQVAPTPTGEQPVRKPRARQRAKNAPTHVRSWPLCPTGAQCREVDVRFFTGVRVFNAVLGEFIARSRAVKADRAWQAARELPHRTPVERKARGAAFRSVETTHGFSVDAVQSYASSLRTAFAEVCGAHRGTAQSQNPDETELLGAYHHYRPDHGDSRTSVYRDSRPARGILAVHSGEDVK